MAINISTLFADIIDTPEQRQEKLLQQGQMQGRLLASGLTGRARALAPLAQMAGQLGVQRNEDIRRAVQPMLGIDPRTTGEKVGEQISELDMSTPQGMLQAAQALQSIDPLRAATLRQAAAEQRKIDQDRERTTALQDIQLAAARRQEQVSLDTEANRSANVLRYKTLGIPDAFVDSYATGELTATDLMKAWSENLAAKAKVKPFKFVSLKGADEKTAQRYIATNEAATNLLDQITEGTESSLFGLFSWGGEETFTAQNLLDEAAVWRSINPSLTVEEAVDEAVKSLPTGGARAILQGGSGIAAQQMQESYNVETGNTTATGSVNLGVSNAGTAESQEGFNSQVADLVNQAVALQASGFNSTAPDVIQEPASASSPREKTSFSQAVSNTFAPITALFDEDPEGIGFVDYLKAAEGMDFPAISTVAKNIPPAAKMAVNAFDILATTFSSAENVKKAVSNRMDDVLNATAKLIGAIVEGQSNPKEQGEQIATNITAAKNNIQKLRSQLSNIKSTDRKLVIEQLQKLENLVIEQSAQLAGAVLD
jgi:hypothetical protein